MIRILLALQLGAMITVFNCSPSWAQVTLWETYQSAGNQAVQEQRAADAERLLLAAVRHIEMVNSEDPRLAKTLNNLAVLYGTQNREVEAEPLLQRALAINEKALGWQHPAVALTLQNLGIIYAAQGNFSEAHDVLRESLGISLLVFGTTHPRIGSTLRTFATVYALEGNFQEAKRLAANSISVFEHALGERHPETTLSMEMMIKLLSIMHREPEAEQLKSRLNRIRQRTTAPTEVPKGVDSNCDSALLK
ncbi:MAG: tetratricopeptide repeat protein [Nitrospira sp.]|jgi:tetratricopeptide (TPR) repeat protein|nr:tetratricopeptide repeat protein [Nitrospira sp. BO4]